VRLTLGSLARGLLLSRLGLLLSLLARALLVLLRRRLDLVLDLLDLGRLGRGRCGLSRDLGGRESLTLHGVVDVLGLPPGGGGLVGPAVLVELAILDKLLLLLRLNDGKEEGNSQLHAE